MTLTTLSLVLLGISGQAQPAPFPGEVKTMIEQRIASLTLALHEDLRISREQALEPSGEGRFLMERGRYIYFGPRLSLILDVTTGLPRYLSVGTRDNRVPGHEEFPLDQHDEPKMLQKAKKVWQIMELPGELINPSFDHQIEGNTSLRLDVQMPNTQYPSEGGTQAIFSRISSELQVVYFWPPAANLPLGGPVLANGEVEALAAAAGLTKKGWGSAMAKVTKPKYSLNKTSAFGQWQSDPVSDAKRDSGKAWLTQQAIIFNPNSWNDRVGDYTEFLYAWVDSVTGKVFSIANLDGQMGAQMGGSSIGHRFPAPDLSAITVGKTTGKLTQLSESKPSGRQILVRSKDTVIVAQFDDATNTISLLGKSYRPAANLRPALRSAPTHAVR